MKQSVQNIVNELFDSDFKFHYKKRSYFSSKDEDKKEITLHYDDYEAEIAKGVSRCNCQDLAALLCWKLTEKEIDAQYAKTTNKLELNNQELIGGEESNIIFNNFHAYVYVYLPNETVVADACVKGYVGSEDKYFKDIFKEFHEPKKIMKFNKVVRDYSTGMDDVTSTVLESLQRFLVSEVTNFIDDSWSTVYNKIIPRKGLIYTRTILKSANKEKDIDIIAWFAGNPGEKINRSYKALFWEGDPDPMIEDITSTFGVNSARILAENYTRYMVDTHNCVFSIATDNVVANDVQKIAKRLKDEIEQKTELLEIVKKLKNAGGTIVSTGSKIVGGVKTTIGGLFGGDKKEKEEVDIMEKVIKEMERRKKEQQK